MNALTAIGKRLFLTGDEAVARAALEVGVEVATGYPGNPGTKAITALIPLARQYGMAVEWSVNEKVALEVATGAAWAGKRSLVGMKMSGVNVMADSLLSIAHSGVNGALVIYAVDDVGVYYGMVEQDTRYYAQLTSLKLHLSGVAISMLIQSNALSRLVNYLQKLQKRMGHLWYLPYLNKKSVHHPKRQGDLASLLLELVILTYKNCANVTLSDLWISHY